MKNRIRTFSQLSKERKPLKGEINRSFLRTESGSWLLQIFDDETFELKNVSVPEGRIPISNTAAIESEKLRLFAEGVIKGQRENHPDGTSPGDRYKHLNQLLGPNDIGVIRSRKVK